MKRSGGTYCSALLYNKRMEIRIYEDYRDMYPDLKGRELTDRLLSHALADAGMPDLEILRTEKGKPYVQAAGGADGADGFGWSGGLHSPNIYISASHSKNLFACLIGDRPLGIDLQHGRKLDPEKIAGRYFAEEEAELVRRLGAPEFFRLWTRKEAFSKYTGRGLEDVMARISVIDRTDVEFLDFQWERDVYCSCCIQREDQRQRAGDFAGELAGSPAGKEQE